MDPELLAYVSGSVQQYSSQKADAPQQDPGHGAARQQDSKDVGKQTEPGAQG